MDDGRGVSHTHSLSFSLSRSAPVLPTPFAFVLCFPSLLNHQSFSPIFSRSYLLLLSFASSQKPAILPTNLGTHSPSLPHEVNRRPSHRATPFWQGPPPQASVSVPYTQSASIVDHPRILHFHHYPAPRGFAVIPQKKSCLVLVQQPHTFFGLKGHCSRFLPPFTTGLLLFYFRQ